LVGAGAGGIRVGVLVGGKGVSVMRNDPADVGVTADWALLSCPLQPARTVATIRIIIKATGFKCNPHLAFKLMYPFYYSGYGILFCYESDDFG